MMFGFSIFFFNWYSVFTGSSIHESMILFLLNFAINCPVLISIGLNNQFLSNSALKKYTALYEDGNILKRNTIKHFVLFFVV